MRWRGELTQKLTFQAVRRRSGFLRHGQPRPGERYEAVYSLPAGLQKRGVKIAFSSLGGSGDVRNLPYAAGYAVAYGLPYDEALKAITLNPVEMFGLGDSLGSLDVGQDRECCDG
jgi:imidazolonepropionase-like amidohydrolase